MRLICSAINLLLMSVFIKNVAIQYNNLAISLYDVM